MKTAITCDLTLKAIRCRLAALQDGQFWTTAKQSAFSWRIHEDPAAGRLYVDSGEWFARSLGRTERRQLTEALRRLEADGKIETIQTGDRTVAVVLLVDHEISDDERQRFDEWRRQFGRLTFEARAVRKAEREAAEQRQAAERERLRAEQSAAYAAQWRQRRKLQSS